MFRKIAVHLAGLLGVMLVVSFLVFSLSSLVPGNQASVIVGTEGATPEEYAQVRAELGLDQPLVIRYGVWLGKALTGDLGTSPTTGIAATEALAQQVPVTGELALFTMIISTLTGVSLGVVAVRKASVRVDLTMRGSLLILFSTPAFVLGVLILFAISRLVPGLSTASYAPWSEGFAVHLRSIWMPVLTMSFPMTAMVMQMTRSELLRVKSGDFIRTAISTGVRDNRIYHLHALRVALPGVVTFVGFQFGVLLGSVVAIEEIFGMPGLGRGMLDAIHDRDYVMVAAITLVLAIAFVIANALVEIVNAWLDPRLRRQ